MLVKEFIGKLNSFNMDAEIEFARGNDFEMELVENEDEKVTNEGNAKKVIFRVVENESVTENEDSVVGSDVDDTNVSDN